MATKHSIPPFPFDLDRDYFGAWISGFVAGEGCFYLGWQRLNTYPRPKAIFMISLRADDIDILQHIRSYFGCGKPIRVLNRSVSKPTATYAVNTISDVYNIICPHFTKFPLLAKKAGDFSIWKEAVNYMHLVSQVTSGPYNVKWTHDRIQQVDEFIALLKDHRQFTHPELDTQQGLQFLH